ncbi:hypothetical protein AA93_12110 [Xylella fastidiosa subsp. pauca 11399]|uniref:hypothetical protein n=1 Tax=Xylella fastidiosa TaxID=2371 RepID=UPI00080AD9A4|nr:hypothetical protein [Xylella fastidiosa]NRP55982.1 hypothetical protein [Xylella fastidiosa]OCA56962.1 hypothetical protein AA93_12110 [Xylella fastidiosa subsp. pauca 11399]
MRKVQTFRLSIICALLLMGACTKEKVPSTSEYLHDIDAANKMNQLAKTNPAKYQNDPAAINATGALVQIQMEGLGKCWPTKPISTATTDHDCLDREGYKR